MLRRQTNTNSTYQIINMTTSNNKMIPLTDSDKSLRNKIRRERYRINKLLKAKPPQRPLQVGDRVVHITDLETGIVVNVDPINGFIHLNDGQWFTHQKWLKLTADPNDCLKEVL